MKVLVIKLRYIGDTVLATPLLRALKAGIQGVQIDVLINEGAQGVLMGHPDIGRIWRFNREDAKRKIGYTLKLIRLLRKERYEMAIDLTNNDRGAFLAFASGARTRVGYFNKRAIRKRLFYTRVVDSVLGDRHTVDHHLKVAEELKLPVLDRLPYLYVSPDSLKKVTKVLSDCGVGSQDTFVIIHPGARRRYKSWPLERFAHVADRIVQVHGIRVVLSGGREDVSANAMIVKKMREQAVDLTGKIALEHFPALAKKALCLLGNDSAPIHIATAVRTPTVALFGPTDWKRWAPRGAEDRVLAVEFPCMPCGHSRAECPLGSAYCMSSIGVEEVWKALNETLCRRIQKGGS